MSEGKEIRIPLRLVVVGLPLIFAVCAAYLVIKDTPAARAAIESKVSDNGEKIGGHEIRISVVEADIRHIKDGINRIERAVTRSSWRRRPTTP